MKNGKEEKAPFTGVKLERFEKTVSAADYVRDFVDVPKFFEFCRVCPNYGKVHSCPPFDFDSAEFWEGFSRIRLILYKMTLEEEKNSDERWKVMSYVRDSMLEELLEEEKKNPGSVVLTAGGCSKCGSGNCTKLSGEPCRFPDRMRHAIESVGGDVVKTSEELFGINVVWTKGDEVPPYMILMNGLLLK